MEATNDKKKGLLQDYIRDECHNQFENPALLICERFIPDGPLHGKCSAVLALNVAIIEAISSNEKDGVPILQQIMGVVNATDLSSFADTIKAKYIEEEDTKYQFRLIGRQANTLLSKYQHIIVNVVTKYYEGEGQKISSLLQVFIFIFIFIFIFLKYSLSHPKSSFLRHLILHTYCTHYSTCKERCDQLPNIQQHKLLFF